MNGRDGTKDERSDRKRRKGRREGIKRRRMTHFKNGFRINVGRLVKPVEEIFSNTS